MVVPQKLAEKSRTSSSVNNIPNLNYNNFVHGIFAFFNKPRIIKCCAINKLWLRHSRKVLQLRFADIDAVNFKLEFNATLEVKQSNRAVGKLGALSFTSTKQSIAEEKQSQEVPEQKRPKENLQAVLITAKLVSSEDCTAEKQNYILFEEHLLDGTCESWQGNLSEYTKQHLPVDIVDIVRVFRLNDRFLVVDIQEPTHRSGRFIRTPYYFLLWDTVARRCIGHGDNNASMSGLASTHRGTIIGDYYVTFIRNQLMSYSLKNLVPGSNCLATGVELGAYRAGEICVPSPEDDSIIISDQFLPIILKIDIATGNCIWRIHAGAVGGGYSSQNYITQIATSALHGVTVVAFAAGQIGVIRHKEHNRFDYFIKSQEWQEQQTLQLKENLAAAGIDSNPAIQDPWVTELRILSPRYFMTNTKGRCRVWDLALAQCIYVTTDANLTLETFNAIKNRCLLVYKKTATDCYNPGLLTFCSASRPEMKASESLTNLRLLYHPIFKRLIMFTSLPGQFKRWPEPLKITFFRFLDEASKSVMKGTCRAMDNVLPLNKPILIISPALFRNAILRGINDYLAGRHVLGDRDGLFHFKKGRI